MISFSPVWRHASSRWGSRKDQRCRLCKPSLFLLLASIPKPKAASEEKINPRTGSCCPDNYSTQEHTRRCEGVCTAGVFFNIVLNAKPYQVAGRASKGLRCASLFSGVHGGCVHSRYFVFTFATLCRKNWYADMRAMFVSVVNPLSILNSRS